MIKRQADIIAENIENQIFSGHFANDERLDEVKLAEQFGVSRTPIREAFQRLANSGLVEQIPRRGVFVRQPSPAQLLDMFEVMAEMEATCARLAAKRISLDAIEEMKLANAQCAAACEQNDTDLYYQENEIFHQILYRESGNSFLEEETKKLHNRLRPFRRTQLKLRGRMEQSLKEHDSVIKALEAANIEAASEAIRNHVAVQGEKFHFLLSNA